MSILCPSGATRIKMKGRNDMKELRQMVKITDESMKRKLSQTKIAFYQIEERWCSFCFRLEHNHTLAPEDRQSLESIKYNDPKAIVIDSDDFIEANGDGSILVDDMVASVTYLYAKGLAKLEDFLEAYEMKESQQEQQEQQQEQPTRLTTDNTIQIMEKELQALSELSECLQGEERYRVAEIMLEIARFLTEVKESWK